MFKEIINILVNNKSKKIAFIENDKRITYYTLSKKSIQIAEKLKFFNQDKIVVFLSDGTDFIYTLCGVILSGKIVFPINTNYTLNELSPLLNMVQPAIITSKKYREIFEKHQMQYETNLNILYIEDITYNRINNFIPQKRNPKKPFLFLNTSGTTGKPKIVMLSENNISACIKGYLNKLDFKILKGKKYILASPFSSAYGLMIIFSCIQAQFTLVMLKKPFNVINMLQTAEKYKVTFFEGGNSVILMLWHLSKSNSELKINFPMYFGFGGSKISSKVLQELKMLQPNMTFWQGYGMTEASPLISKLQVEEINQNFNSVGTAIIGETIKISKNNKLTSMPNKVGEIVVKGKNVMLGYYKNKNETKKIIKKGYLYTGDIGYIGNNNLIYIVGRKKNIIIIRGMNVSIEEVESTIINSGFVKDCIVYSSQDSLENEVMCANIIPISSNISPQIIINYCKKNLASYKIPYKINLVDKINKTVSGKNIIGKNIK